MRFWSFQTLINGYWCLGNDHNFSPLCVHHDELRPAVVKVIMLDGVVYIYRRAIRASELMMQFPKHLVCHSHSFFIGQKIQPLSPQSKLQIGHNYFLLPTHFFQTVLTFVSIAASFASSRAVVGACQAFDIRKAPSGSLQIRVSDEFVSKLMQQARTIDEQEETTKPMIKGRILCSTPELDKDYTQLVSYRREWKPKLETIKESKRKKISSSSFGIKRRKKCQPNLHQKITHKPKQDHHQKSTKFKIKIKSKR